MPEGQGKSDVQLRTDALAVLAENRHGVYTVPAIGLYPYQWCWDTGPDRARLGRRLGEWDQAWGELDKLFSAQWPSGMVPHIVFWAAERRLLPRPRGLVHRPGRRATTGLTQPPLPVSAAARLFTADPDRDHAHASRSALLWPRLVAWLAWIDRARTGPHRRRASSCTRGSRAWTTRRRGTSRSLATPEVVAPTTSSGATPRPSSAKQRPSTNGVPPLPRHRRRAARRRAGTPRRQVADSPFAVEDPAFTAIIGRAPASDLAAVAEAAGQDGSDVDANRHPGARRHRRACGTKRSAGTAPYDVPRRQADRGRPRRAGSPAMFGGANHDHAQPRWSKASKAWSSAVKYSGAVVRSPPTTSFDPIRYWRAAGVGARELAGRRRASKLAGLDDDAGGAAGRDPRPRRAGLHRVLRPPRRHRRSAAARFSWSAAPALELAHEADVGSVATGSPAILIVGAPVAEVALEVVDRLDGQAVLAPPAQRAAARRVTNVTGVRYHWYCADEVGDVVQRRRRARRRGSR